MGNITAIGSRSCKGRLPGSCGPDAMGTVVMRKRLRRGQVLASLPRCQRVWSAWRPVRRRIIGVRERWRWPRSRLMPPQYVKAYVKRNKNDVADAEAICEAVKRPSMRFVPVKTAEQQSALMMHRGGELLVRQRTMLANALRGHLAEFGLIAAQGLQKASSPAPRIAISHPTRVTTTGNAPVRTGGPTVVSGRTSRGWATIRKSWPPFCLQKARKPSRCDEARRGLGGNVQAPSLTKRSNRC